MIYAVQVGKYYYRDGSDFSMYDQYPWTFESDKATPMSQERADKIVAHWPRRRVVVIGGIPLGPILHGEDRPLPRRVQLDVDEK